MGDHLDKLRTRLADVHNLERASAVLTWDQHTYMPPAGAAARGEQMATLSRLAHEIFTDPRTGELLAASAREVADLPPDGDDARLVRLARRQYDRAVKVPPALVSEMRKHAAVANPIWVRARQENDFASFEPCLGKTVQLSREMAEHLGYEDSVYDALLQEFEPGMKTSQVRAIFDALKPDLVELVAAISERLDLVDDSVLHQPFDEAGQEAFGRMVVERFGYDFSRGRQDRTVHPFEITFSRNDVRITTRFEPDFLSPALFGTLHEGGHGMYEQGVGESLDGTMLGRGTSLGFHESQSRLWENVVGRSRPLWQHFYPHLQRAFPGQLGDTDLETFYKAINKVQPSFVRVEADEVTYNLHIMLRFEMEIDMLEGRFPVSEAPAVWNQKMDDYLGIRPPTDSLGILQDIHWSGGMLGYFSTYSLGNITSVQLYDRAVQEVPDIPEQIARGRFEGLHGWLTDRIYRHGSKFEPNELIQRVTGEPLQSRSYLAYLRRKYGEIYEL
ncbi:MAG: carboxypeptidase M32 [Chloroflexi bacterium]|nr:carboxypeptidase M32 [Chloroflexota bacterium]